MIRISPNKHRKPRPVKVVPRRADEINAQLKAQKARDDRKALLMARIADITKRHGGGHHE